MRRIGERETIVVSQPVDWKNEPYSTATLPPPTMTQRVGS